MPGMIDVVVVVVVVEVELLVLDELVVLVVVLLLVVMGKVWVLIVYNIDAQLPPAPHPHGSHCPWMAQVSPQGSQLGGGTGFNRSSARSRPRQEPQGLATLVTLTQGHQLGTRLYRAYARLAVVIR